jgi:hypothetical protein
MPRGHTLSIVVEHTDADGEGAAEDRLELGTMLELGGAGQTGVELPVRNISRTPDPKESPVSNTKLYRVQLSVLRSYLALTQLLVLTQEAKQAAASCTTAVPISVPPKTLSQRIV